MKGKSVIYIAVFLWTNCLFTGLFIERAGVSDFATAVRTNYIMDHAGLLSPFSANTISSMNEQLKRVNSVQILVWTFEEEQSKEDIGYWKKTLKMEDELSFIINIFPNNIAFEIHQVIQPYFSDLLLKGYQQQLEQGRKDGRLEEVLIEIASHIQNKLESFGWMDVQIAHCKKIIQDVTFWVTVEAGKTKNNEYSQWLKRNLDKINKNLCTN